MNIEYYYKSYIKRDVTEKNIVSFIPYHKFARWKGVWLIFWEWA
jgi:hypothetical protein